MMETDLLHLLGLDYLANPQKRLYWPYLVSTLIIVFVYSRVRQQTLSSVFTKNIWWHASARLDYAYFLIISLMKISLILPLIFSINTVAFYILNVLQNNLGYQATLNIDPTLLILFYTLSLFIVSDFSRYLLHRLLHAIPFLWAFHKVHHSAQVLTPITFYRVHPVENILFGFRYALVAGTITGVFVYYFGTTLSVLELFGINAFVVSMHFIGDNLRHSPVRLGYFNALENWFISPAQHQYHHTITGNNKNFGSSLAIWDRLFGTLKHSDQQDSYQFGINDQQDYNSLFKLLLFPFKKAFSHD